MIIRCPQCEHTRTISEGKIPPGAETVTCPRCRTRFRFRTLDPSERRAPDVPAAPSGDPVPLARDIWEAMDSIQHTREERTASGADSPQSGTAPARAEDPVFPDWDVSVPPVPGRCHVESLPEKAQPETSSPFPEPGRDAPEAPDRTATVLPAYDAEGASPEERVARDIRLLQADAGRPTRNLGKIEDYTGPDRAEASARESAPAWEHPARLGWLRSYARTVRGVLFDADDFFKGLSSSEGAAHAFLFFLIQGYLAVVASLVWRRAAWSLFFSEPSPDGRLAAPVLLLALPLILGFFQIFMAGAARLLIGLIRPEQADLQRLFKIVGYASAPLLFCVIPGIGTVAGALWFLVAAASGCRYALGLPWPAAALATAPAGGLFLFCLGYAFA